MTVVVPYPMGTVPSLVHQYPTQLNPTQRHLTSTSPTLLFLFLVPFRFLQIPWRSSLDLFSGNSISSQLMQASQQTRGLTSTLNPGSYPSQPIKPTILLFAAVS